MPATSPAIDALERPMACVCGKVFTPDRRTISAALNRGTASRFYCSAACVGISPEANEKRRARIRERVAAGTWAGPDSLSDPEIRLMTRQGVPCGQCGETFKPTRDVAHRYLRNKQDGIFCSRECSGIHYSAVKGGVPRDPASGFGKAEHNVNAHFYCVKSPDNVQYVFRNANHFVREHPHLFTAEQRREGRKNIIAASGLRSLFIEKMDYRAGRKRQPETWRGWSGVWKKDRLGNVVWTRGDGFAAQS